MRKIDIDMGAYQRPIKRWVASNRTNIIVSVIVVVVAIVILIISGWLWGGEGVRTALLIFAGIGAIYGLLVRTKQLNLAKKAQDIDTLARAVDQLGNESSSIRSAGVHLLRHMHKEMAENHDNQSMSIINDILSDFVRDKSRLNVNADNVLHDPPKKGERADVENAIRSFGIMIPKWQWSNIRFNRLDLRNLTLDFINFRGFDLSESHLDGSSFLLANLSNVVLLYTHFKGADLMGANLTGVDFKGADLSGTRFTETDCTECDFSQVKLVGPQNNPDYSLKQNQVNGMLYDHQKPPALPKRSDREALILPTHGAYEIRISQQGIRQRWLIEAGKWVGH